MGFVKDSLFSLVKTELKELLRIFALFLSSKLNSPCLSTNGTNLSLVLDFVLTNAKKDLESLFMFSANFRSNFCSPGLLCVVIQRCTKLHLIT